MHLPKSGDGLVLISPTINRSSSKPLILLAFYIPSRNSSALILVASRTLFHGDGKFSAAKQNRKKGDHKKT
jgi:hypothetical protein